MIYDWENGKHSNIFRIGVYVVWFITAYSDTPES